MSRAGPRTPAASSPAARTGRRPSALRTLLTGGDRRSIAQSKRAQALLRKEPPQVTELVKLAEDKDWLVSMRALDLLEKLAHEEPALVQPYKRLFIGSLADSDKWEIRLQVVRALPLLKWTVRERKRVIEILRGNLEHPQKFVRAWALDSLATFALANRELLPLVLRSLVVFERSPSKALATRARHIRDRLDRDRVE